MLDDPFVLPQPPTHTTKRPTSFFGGNSPRPQPIATSAAAPSAQYSLLLSGHASKFKSSALLSGASAAGSGKENGLLPSPRFGFAVSSSSSSSSSSTTGPSSSSSPPRDGETTTSSSSSSNRLLRKNLKPALKRRVTFSPTPLASLQSSPSHAKRARPIGLLFPQEHERETKRRRRENVYSDNPLLEAARSAAPPEGRLPFRAAKDDDGDAGSGSDVRQGGHSSSPPTSPKLPLLPRSPPRPRTKPTAVGLGSYASSSFAPFSLVASSAAMTPVAYDAGADAEATDSEEESEQVESLLLPASVSPKKPAAKSTSDPALVLPPPLSKHQSLLGPASAFSPMAEASTSSSSSPLRSPSTTLSRSARPTPSLLPDPPLRSILKQKAPSGNFIVKDEREGLRKNGRGRRHVVGWDGEKKLKAAREKRIDEQTAAAVAAREAEEADASGSAPKDKGKGKAREGGNSASASRPSYSARATRSSARTTRLAAAGLGNGGDRRGDDDEEPPRRRQGAPASTSKAAGKAHPNPKRDPTRFKHELQLDDPAQFRSPLQVLRASLEAATSPSHSDAVPVLNGIGSSLLPRPPKVAVSLAPLPAQQHPIGPTISDVLTLKDVEDAYVSLKNAVFCLPSVLADADTTLEPLRTHGQALLGALTRDIENIKSFPLWAAEQPRLRIEPDELVLDAEAPAGDADEPSSSPSLNRRASTAVAVAPGAKASLTEVQMTRMRDELGAAQAAVKCAAACFRDTRVVALFTPEDLAKLVEAVFSVAVAPDLSVSVRRDFFPFLPFFLSSIAATTTDILPDLLVPTILPGLRVTLTLDARIDRFRQSLSESLDALAVLLPLHGQVMLDSDAWRLWLREAAMGLWDGTKKMVSTHDKAVKVLGRVVRILTVPIQSSTWSAERETIHAAISQDLHELFTSSPPGAEIDPTDEKKERRYSYLDTLLFQLGATPGSSTEKAREANANATASKQIATLSVLALLPALLGAEFRHIVPKGIGPWLRAFNALSTSTSSPVLVLTALAWPHLAFAFLRVPGPAGQSWMFRPKSYKQLTNYLSIFKSRADRWQRPLEPSLEEDRKEQARLHAKALALAFVGVIYGATVYVRHGTTSVRNVAAVSATSAVPAGRLPIYDRIFDEILEFYLPALTQSPILSECNTIGWQILARICRSKGADDRSVWLESLINPIFLDGSLAIIPPESAKMGVLLDAATQRAVKPAALPGWSEQWIGENVDKVLGLLQRCLPTNDENTAERILAVQQQVLDVWQNLLRTIAGQAQAVAQAVQWLTRFSLEHSELAEPLWSSLFARAPEAQLQGVETAMQKDPRACKLAIGSWVNAADRRFEYADVFAKVASRRLTGDMHDGIAQDELDAAVLLLRERTKAETLEELGTDQCGLAESILRFVWSASKADSTTSREILQQQLASSVSLSSDLRLCAKFVAGSQRLDTQFQQEVLAFCSEFAISALAADATSATVKGVTGMLQTAHNSSYPPLYTAILTHLQSNFEPSKETFERFSALLISPLRRAVSLTTSAGDIDTQALLQAPPPSREPSIAHLGLIQSFEAFWRTTFAPLEDELDLSQDIADLLQIVRGIVHPPSGGTSGSSLRTTAESMPVPGQVAVASYADCRTTASDDRLSASRAGYEADISRLPPLATSELISDSRTDRVAPESSRRKIISPSLRAPAGDLRVGVPNSPAAMDDTQMIDETQNDVLTREAHASFAAMSSRLASEADESAAMLGVSAASDGASKGLSPRKRLRKTLAGSDTVSSSSADDTPSDTSSGRRRVGKRRRIKASRSDRAQTDRSGAYEVRQPLEAARPHDQLPSRSDEHTSPHDQATDDIVSSFLALPIETVVSVSKRIGGSPGLRRLITLGERARDYFERLNSASPQ
ncbi:hypothetical protein JCM10908_006105 [Rhodotorula pacifica]|uniref:uncharacterized protein n=1 Tax=Rhodotorula pacifica TaxID=1495444 RepID=UPI0031716999